MTGIDLNSLSLDELKSLQKDVTKAIDDFTARKRAEALAKAEAAAREAGYSLADLVGAKGAKAPSVPKYRNPEDPSQTWTGRGRKPNWFVALVDGGTDPDDLLI